MKLYASSVAWAIATTVWLDKTTAAQADDNFGGAPRRVSRHEVRRREARNRDLSFSYLVDHKQQPLSAADPKDTTEVKGRAVKKASIGKLFAGKKSKSKSKSKSTEKAEESDEDQRNLIFSYLVDHDQQPLSAVGKNGVSVQGRAADLEEEPRGEFYGKSSKKSGESKKRERGRRDLIFSYLVDHDQLPLATDGVNDVAVQGRAGEKKAGPKVGLEYQKKRDPKKEGDAKKIETKKEGGKETKETKEKRDEMGTRGRRDLIFSYLVDHDQLPLASDGVNDVAVQGRQGDLFQPYGSVKKKDKEDPKKTEGDKKGGDKKASTKKAPPKKAPTKQAPTKEGEQAPKNMEVRRRDLIFSYLVDHDRAGLRGVAVQGRTDDSKGLGKFYKMSAPKKSAPKKSASKKTAPKKSAPKKTASKKTASAETGPEERRRKLFFGYLTNNNLTPGPQTRAEFAKNNEPIVGEAYGFRGSSKGKGKGGGGGGGGGRMNGNGGGNRNGDDVANGKLNKGMNGGSGGSNRNGNMGGSNRNGGRSKGKGSKGGGVGGPNDKNPGNRITTGRCRDICEQPSGPAPQCVVDSALQWQDRSADSCCCSGGTSYLKLQLSDLEYFESNDLQGRFYIVTSSDDTTPDDTTGDDDPTREASPTASPSVSLLPSASPSPTDIVVQEVVANARTRGRNNGRKLRKRRALQNEDPSNIRIIPCDDRCLTNPKSRDSCMEVKEDIELSRGGMVCFARVDANNVPLFDQRLPTTIRYWFEANDGRRYFNDINTSCENPLVYPWASMALREGSSPQSDPILSTTVSMPLFIFQGGISVGSYQAAINDRSNEAGFQLDPAECGCDCDAIVDGAEAPTPYPTLLISCDPTDGFVGDGDGDREFDGEEVEDLNREIPDDLETSDVDITDPAPNTFVPTLIPENPEDDQAEEITVSVGLEEPRTAAPIESTGAGVRDATPPPSDAVPATETPTCEHPETTAPSVAEERTDAPNDPFVTIADPEVIDNSNVEVVQEPIPLPDEIPDTGGGDSDTGDSDTDAPIAVFPPTDLDTVDDPVSVILPDRLPTTGSDTDAAVAEQKTTTSIPTESPTPSPTDSPTSSPSDGPTSSPTDEPTSSPTTSSPTTSSPTSTPTSAPTASPTASPTDVPSDKPSCTDQPVHFALEANTCGFDSSEKSIYDYLCSVNNFSNFCYMIQMAGLRDTFSGVDGNTNFMTLFAPTNAGCASGGLTRDKIAIMDQDLLKHIVMTHATDGKVRAESLQCDGELPTLKGTFSVHTTKCFTSQHARAQYGFFNVEGQYPMILSPNNLELCNGYIQPVNNMIRVINY